MATTAYPVNSLQTVKVWGKRLMREALKQTYVNRFMGDTTSSLVYMKDELTKGAGDQIKYSLRMQLSGTGVSGDGVLEGNEEELTLYQDSILIDQYRHAVRSGGRMSDQRVPFSVREEALDGLRDWWADRIDACFFNHIAGNTLATAALLTNGNNTITAASSTRITLGGMQTSTTASLTATTTNSGSIRGTIFQLRIIDRLVNIAKTASPLIRPVMVNSQPKYVMFLHPNQVRQLKKAPLNTGQITWFDVMRARAEGGDVKTNPIYNGAIGEYAGVILHESTRVPAPVAADTAVKAAIFCGAQAACIGFGQEDKDRQMKWVEEYFDYENQLGVSAAMIFGVKKTVFNSVDFGTIVCQTKSADPI